MKTRLFAAALAAAAIALSGCASVQPHPSNAATHHNVTELAASAESGVFITGTLATLGSFEWDAAPLTNHAATALHNIAVAVKEGRVSKADGQAQIDEIDHAHDLIKQALAACAQNSQTGKCAKDEPGARALLDQARAALSDVP